MYSYGIPIPFNLKWKFVAPIDFQTIEYFITPRISLSLNKITNGKNLFSLGAVLMGTENQRKFDTEYMPRRSQERVELAFREDDVSVFLTEEEAKKMDAIFDEYKFICNFIRIIVDGQSVDLFELRPEDFEVVIEVMRELGVQQITDIKTDGDPFVQMRDDMYEAAYKKAKKDFDMVFGKKNYVNKKKVRISLLVASLVMGLGVACKALGRFLFNKGPFGVIAGAILYISSFAISMIGFKLMSEVIEQIDEGVIFG